MSMQQHIEEKYQDYLAFIWHPQYRNVTKVSELYLLTILNMNIKPAQSEQDFGSEELVEITSHTKQRIFRELLMIR